MANGFEIPSQAAAQGLLSGAQTGLQLGQMNRQNRIQDEQQRQAKWEQGYKTAALAIQTAGITGLPDEMKARVLNNGFLPLWNNSDFDVAGNNKTPFEPFTAESMQDKELQNVIKESKRLATDKELSQNPELQMQAVTGLWMDYHAKKGNKAEAQKLALDLAKGATEKGKQITADEDTFRKEFIGQTKDFQDTARAFRKIDDSAVLGTAPGDMSMIFAYMKMLDPGSTVREGEYATAEAARGVPASIVANYNKAVDGQKLTPAQREQFVSAAEAIYKGQEAQFSQLEQDYRSKTSGRGGNPDNGVVDYRYRRPAKGSKSVPAGASQAGGGKPKTIQQGGHTYVLNEKTGEYE